MTNDTSPAADPPTRKAITTAKFRARDVKEGDVIDVVNQHTRMHQTCWRVVKSIVPKKSGALSIRLLEGGEWIVQPVDLVVTQVEASK